MNAPTPDPAMFRCKLKRVSASDRRRTVLPSTMFGVRTFDHWAPLYLTQELPTTHAVVGSKVYLDLAGAGREVVAFGYIVESVEPTTLKWFWPPYLLAGGADTYGDV